MMSIPRLAAILLASVALGAARPPALAAQTSYPLICRGGAGLMLVAVQAGPGTPSNVRLKFTRGQRGAVGGVEPGTCAWQDRGVRANEPAVLCFGPAQHVSFEMAGGRQVGWMRVQASAGGAPVIFWDGGERPDGIAYQPGNAAELEYYRAYHDASRSCLAVNHVGP